MRPRLRIAAPIAIALAVVSPRMQETTPTPRAPEARTAKSDIPFAEARSTLDVLRESWPADLRGLTPDALERSWPDWVRRRDADIRARLERGDEDSIVNLWLYGTAFTRWPRAAEPDLTELANGATAAEIVAGRLEDLLDAMADPGQNERVQFARGLFERRGLNPATTDGRARIRRALGDARQRVIAEYRGYEREVDSVKDAADPSAGISVHATLFRDRGLSSDTSILASFAVEQGLRGIVSARTLGPGSVRHIGIVGPGLDFTNKSDGHDFYPQQTTQPFALVDSLIRLGLADPNRLRVTTFDLSPRVNQHLEGARRRAEGGEGYALHLPLNRVDRWRPDLLDYWTRFGDGIADPVSAVAAPWAPGAGMVRAVRVRPAHVLSIVPRDVNIVLERLAPLADEDRFDLLVATNVLVYYSRFEQSLALANAAAMLRPGGVFLTNNAVFPIPPFTSSAQYLFVVYSDRQNDHVFWYHRE